MTEKLRELPTVRIQKVTLENFKSVEYGEMEMACGKKFVPYDTQSDILGIYGQNGSGKTSMIEALAILKYLVMGDTIPDDYADCIREGKESSRLKYTFDFQYPNGDIRKVIYEVTISFIEPDLSKNEFEENYSEDVARKRREPKYLVKVKRECVKVSGDFYGGKLKLQPIIDTSAGDPFGPVSKRKEFVEGTNDISKLSANKSLAWNLSKSFVFMDETTDVFETKSAESEFVNILLDLKLFASAYLYVVDTKSSGLIRLNVALPVIFRRIHGNQILTRNRIILGIDAPNKLPQEIFDDITDVFNNINIVLKTLIPGLTIGLKDLGPVLTRTGKTYRYSEVIANRDGVELPLRYESDGVKKIISTLQLFIEAYNDSSMTVAIDEFDARVFEYLLGEMLTIFEEYGKGQFIFTSHNLRPLEVINKNFICFTTTAADDRYTRIDNVKPNNNLRNVYFKEIELGGEEVDLYASEKKYKIVQALRKAGKVVGKKNEDEE